MLGRYTRQNEMEYINKRREAKHLFRNKKRASFQRKLENIKQEYSNKNAKEFYKEVNSVKRGFKPRTTLIKDSMGNIIGNEEQALLRWSEYFLEHFKLNKGNGNGQSMQERGKDQLQTAELYIKPPDEIDVEMAIDKLKQNKAPGYDLIPAEMIKKGGRELRLAILKLIQRIWENEIIPQEWKVGMINPIYKKGDNMMCENYRAITLLHTTYKILANILYNRMSPYMEQIIGDYQCGFRSGRSTTDQIFIMRQLIEKCWEQNIDTHHLFLDFESAYDSVLKDEIWEPMHHIGFPEKLINLCRIISSETYAVVKIGKKISPKFMLEKGIRQGDAIAPVLFNIALEIAIQRSGIQTRGTIFINIKVNECMYVCMCVCFL